MPEIIERVMLIDDEEIDQRMYERVLKKSGLVNHILTFDYADEALEFLLNNRELEVDVIFLDINMPRMTGFEFLDAAAERMGSGFAKIVVAMLTTSLDPQDEQRAAENDLVRKFINKPLTVDDVRDVAAML